MDYDAAAREICSFAEILQRGPGQHLRAVSTGEYAVLGFLAHAHSDVAPTDIAARFMLTTARVANILNDLERKGYVARRRDPADGRRVIVSITDEGSRVSDEKRRAAEASVRWFLERLGDADAADYLRLKRREYEIIRESQGRPASVPGRGR